jgi:hypothetical protein
LPRRGHRLSLERTCHQRQRVNSAGSVSAIALPLAHNRLWTPIILRQPRSSGHNIARCRAPRV